jgi:hypothetical protein
VHCRWQTLQAPIYTGDRDWLKLHIDADIKLIR